MYYSLVFLVVFAGVLVTAQDQCADFPRVHPPECCPNLPRLITPEIAQECGLPSPPPAGQFPPGPPPGFARSGGAVGGFNAGTQGKGPFSCDGVTCFLKKFDLIKDDKVNRATFAKVLTERFGSEWKSAVDAAVSTCNKEVDASTTECEPMVYYGCFKMNFVKNCPDSIWVKSTECASLKTFMENCPPPGPPPMG